MAHASSPTNTQIPPESPAYIEIPRSVQSQAPYRTIIKGVLPVPRQLFPPGSRAKARKTYLDQVTREPKRSRNLEAIEPSTAQFIDWKARLAASRRKNLREGLLELNMRKRTQDSVVAQRSAVKQAEHERRVHAPEHEDERLTKPTVPQFMTSGILGQARDPGRAVRVAESRARTESVQAEKREERRNALHSLYMNARDFIVTEAEWNAKIDEVFDDKFFKNEDTSIWDKYQSHSPETVLELLSEANKMGRNAIRHNQGYATITRDRVQKIAEELTGGRMD